MGREHMSDAEHEAAEGITEKWKEQKRFGTFPGEEEILRQLDSYAREHLVRPPEPNESMEDRITFLEEMTQSRLVANAALEHELMGRAARDFPEIFDNNPLVYVIQFAQRFRDRWEEVSLDAKSSSEKYEALVSLLRALEQEGFALDTLAKQVGFRATRDRENLKNEGHERA